MQNVKMKRDKDMLTVEIDLSKNLGRSASGKSINIATTAGNKPVPGGDDIKIGLNVYRPAKAA